jgi:type 1 glutamine amidotransferase
MRLTKACLLLFGAILAFAAAPRLPAAETAPAFRVLVFSKTTGYRHASITNGIAAIQQLGAQNNFSVDATEEASAFTSANLARYQAVVLLSVTGEVLDTGQKAAFRDYILGGGGLAAIHGAAFGPSACEDKWSWYGEVFCCAFKNHSAIVPATVNVEDGSSPSMTGVPARWQRSDEWYNFTGTPRACAHVLATVDESTYSGGTMGADHPISWCRRVGNGRMWYTAMGHNPEAFSEPLFLQHILGGILTAAAQAPADFAPNSTMLWRQTDGTVSLLRNGQPIWRFNFGTNESKPFFNPVALPGGPSLTWNSPSDHRWHHALWFSWKYINGLNYWEEDPKTGRSEGVTAWRQPRIETWSDYSAHIVMELDYHPPGASSVMTEHRVIDVSRPEKDGSYHLDWELTFTAADKDVLLDRTPIPGDPGGQAWGGYAGLSVRFPREMQDIQTWTSQGPIAFTKGTYRGNALAMDYSGVIEKLEAGIAILDHPANLNSPSPWYAIYNSNMSYFSPAVICYHPYSLKADQSLSLRYRVVVHPGRWTPEQLRAAEDRYAARQ